MLILLSFWRVGLSVILNSLDTLIPNINTLKASLV